MHPSSFYPNTPPSCNPQYGDKALQLPNPLNFWKTEEKEGAKNEMPDPGVVVGDIMDGVASGIGDFGSIQVNDIIDETIERESWVPPKGNRWAISAPGMDLTGKWKVIINERFKQDYDDFLQSLGECTGLDLLDILWTFHSQTILFIQANR